MMLPAFFSTGALLLCLARSAWASYPLARSISGSGFLDAFSVESIPDPTHGRTNYVDGATAVREGLVHAKGDRFVLRADDQKTISWDDPGRDSVRLRSNDQYTTSVIIFDLEHMPEGCGTWPAVWTVGARWPDNGEIDIVEGVNNHGPNLASLHTAGGCSMPHRRSQTGTAITDSCDAGVGCGVGFNDERSFGPSFNQNQGGVFAMERTNSYIKIWFWNRGSGKLPSDVSKDSSSVNPDTWGTPTAFFPNDECSIEDKFADHSIIINVAFCGDWAGKRYGESGCPSSCEDFVHNNPGAFKNAFFDFGWMNIYA